MLALILAAASQLGPNVPPQVESIVEIRSEVDRQPAICMGSIVGPIQVLGASHCSGSGQVEVRGIWGANSRKSWTARLLWRDTERDIALFIVDTPQTWTAFSAWGKTPKVGDRCSFGMYLYTSKGEATPTVVSGTCIGEDADGDLVINAPIVPGSSGSPVLNAAGEIVGVVTMGSLRSQVIVYATPLKAYPRKP